MAKIIALYYIVYAATKRETPANEPSLVANQNIGISWSCRSGITTRKKKRGQFSAILKEQVWLIKALLYDQNIVLNYIIHAATKGEPPPPPSPCTLTGSQSKHRNQLIVPLPEVLLYNLLALITDISSTQMREVYQAILWTILILVGNLRNLNMFKARLK